MDGDWGLGLSHYSSELCGPLKKVTHQFPQTSFLFQKQNSCLARSWGERGGYHAHPLILPIAHKTLLKQWWSSFKLLGFVHKQIVRKISWHSLV